MALAHYIIVLLYLAFSMGATLKFVESFNLADGWKSGGIFKKMFILFLITLSLVYSPCIVFIKLGNSLTDIY